MCREDKQRGRINGAREEQKHEQFTPAGRQIERTRERRHANNAAMHICQQFSGLDSPSHSSVTQPQNDDLTEPDAFVATHLQLAAPGGSGNGKAFAPAHRPLGKTRRESRRGLQARWQAACHATIVSPPPHECPSIWWNNLLSVTPFLGRPQSFHRILPLQECPRLRDRCVPLRDLHMHARTVHTCSTVGLPSICISVAPTTSRPYQKCFLESPSRFSAS